MKVGKLSNIQLEEYIFSNISLKRKEVLTSASIGIDNAVLDIGDDLAVLSIDPITGSTKDLGVLAVNVSCNDISCQGAEPVGILLSILLPPETELEDLKKIIIDANKESNKLNLDIIGGHTEVTDAVNKIVVTSTVLGRVKKNTSLNYKNINSGDIIAISKSIGIEGSSIIYSEKKEELRNILSKEEKYIIEKFKNSLSVLKESKIAMKNNVKFMHDITEGGVYGALLEVSHLLNKRIEINNDSIPIEDVTMKISDHFNINPYKLISSGSMLFVLKKEDFIKLKIDAAKENISISAIGIVKEGKDLYIKDKDKLITEVESDELYKVV
ncbi:MAG: AIR synthase family protein [Peptoniphilaceae bacterium]